MLRISKRFKDGATCWVILRTPAFTNPASAKAVMCWDGVSRSGIAQPVSHGAKYFISAADSRGYSRSVYSAITILPSGASNLNASFSDLERDSA